MERQKSAVDRGKIGIAGMGRGMGEGMGTRNQGWGRGGDEPRIIKREDTVLALTEGKMGMAECMKREKCDGGGRWKRRAWMRRRRK